MAERKSKTFWDEHVAAAQRSGKPLAQYAAEHGLNREVLYAARQRRIRVRAASVAKPVSAFVPVKVASAHSRAVSGASVLIARLPNGVVIECEPSLWSEAQTRVLMAALASV